jgi:hypothetical protein
MVTPFSKIIITLLITAIFTLTGCDEDFKRSPDDYLNDWPQEASYTSENEPNVPNIPEDLSLWDDLELPLNVEGEDTGEDNILYSVTLSHYWLLKNMTPTGNYLYEWNADTDESSGSTSTIQMLAVAWSQALLYRFANRTEFLVGSYRALKANISGLAETEDPDVGTIVTHSKNVQRTCFTLFTMLEIEDITGTDQFGDQVELMGKFFKNQVDDAGCVWTKYPASGECDDSYSEFAIGQTMVALERLYRYTGDESYLDSLEKASKYYFEYFQNHSFQAYFAAWNTGPIVSMLLERPNAEIEDWIYRMADYMVGDQYQPGDREDYVGGFKKRAGLPPTWSTASMIEPIIDAYRLAQARGDETRMETYYDAGRYGLHFLTHLQYRASNVEELGLVNPDKAIGAYHFSHWAGASSINHHFVRCDYMDHFAITILKGISYLSLPATYPGDGFALNNQ